MCDCIPSSAPLTFSSIGTQNLRLHSFDSKLRNRRIESFSKIICRNHSSSCSLIPLQFKNGGFQILRVNLIQKGGETKKLKSKSCLKVRSENYELFDELGFKEKGNEGFEIETDSRDGKVENDHSNSTPKEEIGTCEASVSSSFDFLELKSDLDTEKRNGGNLEDEELDQIKSTRKVELRSEELGEIEGRRDLRKRRQVMRRTNMVAKQVISVQSALSLGFISQLWVDTCSWVVVVVEVRPSMLSGEMERFLLEDVCQVGDVVLVEDEGVLENDIKMIGLDTLVGYNVVTPSRRSIGKVRGYTFNINSGAVELLELDSFGISIIPSSLVSTYALFVEDVVDVESDTVVVHEAATSRVQRLTKGFWDTPNIDISKDQLEEFPDLERSPIQSNAWRSSRKFTSTKRETEDDWQLPMDYM